MATPKATCAHCKDLGYSQKWHALGHKIGGRDTLFVKKGKVFKCPNCEKPEEAPPLPQK